MRTWILSLSLFFVSFAFTNTSVESVDKPDNIQILLAKEVSEALLEVKGSYNIFDPKDGVKIGSGLLGKRFLVHSTHNGLRWGEAFPGIHQIYVSPRSESSSILLNGMEYKGSIGIYKVGRRLYIINDVAIEDYIKSVLTPQFPYPLASEVMASVAILARTDAYYLVTKYQDTMWQADSKEINYQGSALIIPNSAVDRSVDLTKHLVLSYPKDGQNLPFAAKWTEHSAGRTASYSTIFRKEGGISFNGVQAPHASLNRADSKWVYSLSKGELAKKMGLNTVTEVDLFIDASSKKTYGVCVKGKEQTKNLNFFAFQQSLGENNIQSNDLQVVLTKDEVHFKGFGKGHGVGLCLYSATSMAQNGENAIQILSKFFPNTCLVNLNAIPENTKSMADNE